MTHTLRVALCYVLLQVLACAPSVQRSSHGITETSVDRERELNLQALQELTTRADALSETSVASDEAAEPLSEPLPVLPVTVLTPGPSPAERGEASISREDLNAFLDRGPQSLLVAVWVEPEMDGERFGGFRIHQLSPDAGPIARSGLRVGDVITAVNGQDISRPETFMQVWDSLRQGDRINVDLVREGQARLFRWAVR